MEFNINTRKRSGNDANLTPSTNRNKKSILQADIRNSFANVQQIAATLSQSLPGNELVKELQTALDSHVEQLNNLLNIIANTESPEEKERKRSLVVISLPEPTLPKPSDCVKADTNTITNMLDTLGVAAAPVSVYRMGHPDPNRFTDRPRRGPRVLKVVMPSSALQRQVFSALRVYRNDLRALPNFQRAIIRPSLTAEDREKDRLVHAELKRRREAGERNLFVKNFEIVCRDDLNG